MASKTTDDEGRPAQSSTDFATRQAELFSEGFSFSGYERDLVCLNLGNGRYADISGVSGADSVTDGRGTVRADFDNDGDLDIFLRSVHGPAHFLFRNEIGSDNGWIRVTLEGTDGPTDAYGAVVRVKSSAGIQTKIKAGGSGFLSQSDPRLLFGLGAAENIEWIEVTWPSGRVQRFTAPQVGTSVLAVEGNDELRPLDEGRFSLPDPLSPEQRLWRLLKLGRGERLPRVTVRELDGGRVDLSELIEDGAPTVVNFWATWCRNCAHEMPALEKLSSSGVRVVGLSVDDEAMHPRIPAFLERIGVGYHVATIDPDQLEAIFTSRDLGIPLSLVIGGDGAVHAVLQGWSDGSEQRLHEALDTLE